MRKLKLFGDRNTGTNAITRLINENSRTSVLPASIPTLPVPRKIRQRLQKNLQTLDVERREARIDKIFHLCPVLWFWKHAATNFTEGELHRFSNIPVVIMVRHPASWLRGLHRNPYHALTAVPDRLEDFVNMPWPTVARERVGSRVLTPITLYNEKIASYIAFSEELISLGGRVIFVRFEDFVSDQPGTFEQIRPLLSKPKIAPTIVSRSTKDGAKDHRYYAEYYGQEKWRSDISAEVWQAIDAGIEWEKIRRFDYMPNS